MRLLNVKSTPRFLILAPGFGVLIALVLISQSPRSATAQYQEFTDQKCGDETTCTDIGNGGPAACPLGTNCDLSGGFAFKTCRPTGDGCINSQTLYGDILCTGTCGKDGPACNYRVYFCAKN